MDHHGPENQAARARAGRLFGHAARSLPGICHSGARVRLARAGHRPRRRGDHERLHLHRQLLAHLPRGCDARAVRCGARQLRNGLRAAGEAHHAAHEGYHPRRFGRRHVRLRCTVRRYRRLRRRFHALKRPSGGHRPHRRGHRRSACPWQRAPRQARRPSCRPHHVQLPCGEELHHGRRRRRHLARGPVRLRRAVSRLHAHVAARPVQRRACQDQSRRLGIRCCIPRLEVQHDRPAGGLGPGAAASLPGHARTTPPDGGAVYAKPCRS